jgi:hypothetical protein
MVLETPKGDDLAEDIDNLALLRAQIGSASPVPRGKAKAVAKPPRPDRPAKPKKAKKPGKPRKSANARRSAKTRGRSK